MRGTRLKRSHNKEKDLYYFSLVSENEDMVIKSQMYKSEQGREKGIASVKKNVLDRSKFEKMYSEDGRYYFNIKAGNGEIIATSKLWDRGIDRDGDIDFVREYLGDEGA